MGENNIDRAFELLKSAIDLLKPAPQPNQAQLTNEERTTINNGWVEVSKLARCARCGEESLAWQQGKSGKFYLCAARRDIQGKFWANRKEFHQCAGGKDGDQ